MAIGIESNIVNLKTQSVISKTAEIVAVINILSDKKHHEYAKEWIETSFNNLSQESLAMLKNISSLPFQGIEFFELVLDTKIFNDVKALAEKIESYDDVYFIYILTGEQISIDKIKSIRKNKIEFEKFIDEMPWLYRGCKDIYQWIMCRTDDFKSNLAKLFLEVDNSEFESAFNSLKDKYDLAIKDIRFKLQKKDPINLASEIMNKAVENSSTVCEYIFIPSYFISPHYVMAFNNYARLFLYDMRKEVVNERRKRGLRLSSEMKILSDKTRLEILRLLILQPCSGKILASRLNLTTATISHHMDLLRSANLIKEIRDKNTKYYSANVDEIDNLIDNLQNYFYNR